MEARRSSLADKLEALESQVAEGVQEVTSVVSNVKEVVHDTVETVRDSVESVKDSVQDTVGAVKETFDVNRQMDHHPWIMLGGAFTLGYVAGRMLPDLPTTAAASAEPQSGGPKGQTTGDGNGYHHQPAVREPAMSPAYAHPSEPPREASWLHGLAQSLTPEIDKLKGLALGAALGFVRDYLRKSVPSDLGSHLAGMIDNMTTKLGGQPVTDDLAAGSKGYQFSDSR